MIESTKIVLLSGEGKRFKGLHTYRNEIIELLQDYDVYHDYQAKLRMAAFRAMKKNIGPIGMINE